MDGIEKTSITDIDFSELEKIKKMPTCNVIGIYGFYYCFTMGRFTIKGKRRTFRIIITRS